MLPLLIDNDFNDRILDGLLRVEPTLDVVHVRDVGLRTAQDPEILAFAATAGRVTISHDVQTMIGHAYARIRAGAPMPGLIVVPQTVPIGKAIAELRMYCVCLELVDFAGE